MRSRSETAVRAVPAWSHSFRRLGREATKEHATLLIADVARHFHPFFAFFDVEDEPEASRSARDLLTNHDIFRNARKRVDFGRRRRFHQNIDGFFK
jgi:hypothetical protein